MTGDGAMRHVVRLMALLALGLPACHHATVLEPQMLPTDSNIAVDLRTDQPQYRIGTTTAKTMMVNRSPSTITMGVCNDVLELQVTGGWHEMERANVACIALALIVAPGDSASLALDLASATVPGTYRVRRFFSVTQGNAATTMYRRSNTFTIVR